MNDLHSSNGRWRKALMGFSMGLLYALLGVSIIGLLFLENKPWAQVAGAGWALACCVMLTLIMVSFFKTLRTKGAQSPSATQPAAPLKTRLPFRIAGVLVGFVLVSSGCGFLVLLGMEAADTLKDPIGSFILNEPLSSLVFAAMGLCALFWGATFSYCCLAGKEWALRR